MNRSSYQNRVRALRVAMGLSQEEAARRAGISTIAWRKVESGARMPRLATAQRIAKVLGASLDELFGSNTTA